MRKRVLSSIFALVLCLAMLPFTAMAEGTGDKILINGTEIGSGYDQGGVKYERDTGEYYYMGTLTLSNGTTLDSIVIGNRNVTIVVNGNVTINEKIDYDRLGDTQDPQNIVITGSGTLTVNGYISAGSSLQIVDGVTVNITNPSGTALVVGEHYDRLTVDNATVNATGQRNGITVLGDITIRNGASVTAKGAEFGIEAWHYENNKWRGSDIGVWDGSTLNASSDSTCAVDINYFEDFGTLSADETSKVILSRKSGADVLNGNIGFSENYEWTDEPGGTMKKAPYYVPAPDSCSYLEMQGSTTAGTDPVTVTPPNAVTGLVYSGNDQTLITAGSTNLYSLEYAVTAASQTNAPSGGYSASLPVKRNAGEYKVWYRVGRQADGYRGTTAQAVEVSIAKANLTITPPTAGTVYVNEVLTAEKLSGGAAMFDGDALRGSFAVPEGQSWYIEGVYPVTVSFIPTDMDAASFVSNTAEISVKVVKRTVASAAAQDAITDRLYGTQQSELGLPFAVSIQTADGKVFDGIPVAWSGYDPDTLEPQTLTGTLTISGFTVLEVQQPADGEVTASITVTLQPKPMTVTAQGFSGTYDGQPHGITVEAPEGAVVKYGTAAGTYDLTESPVYTDAETYTVYYQVTKYGYQTVTASETVKIAPKEVTVSGITAESRDYDGGIDAGLRYDAVQFDGKLESDVLTVTAKGAFADKNVGTAKTVFISELTLGGSAAANYVLAEDGQQTETAADIRQKDITVTITPGGGTYGETITPAEAELNGVVSGDTTEAILRYSGSANDGVTIYMDAASAPTKAGTYTVTASMNDSNYNLTGTTTAVFVVEKAAVEVPEAKSVVYTGAPQTAELPGSARYTVTVNDGGTDVGTYPVKLALTDAANYKWSSSEAAEIEILFRIVQAENRWSITPAIEGWTYGEAGNAPVGAAVFGTPIVEYRPLSGSDADYSTAVPTDAGRYLVRFTVNGTENYTGLSEVRELTIVPKTVGIRWSEETDFVYNGQPQAPSAEATGLVGEDACTVTVTGAEIDAGEYTTAASALSNPNYQLPAKGLEQDYVIAQKVVTIKLADARMHCGQELPALTAYTVEGLLQGDALLTPPTQTTKADGSEVGTFAITASGADAGPNYQIVYVNGTLDVQERRTVSDPIYPPNVSKTEGGRVSISDNAPEKGDKVTITVKPNKGYEIDDVVVTDKDGDEIRVKDNGDGTYTFTQPAGKVKIAVSFAKIGGVELPFTDVSKDDPYYDAAAFMFETGLMVGVGDGTQFAPEMPLNRAMIVQILYRYEGEPAAAASAFADVARNFWYTDAIDWAAQAEVIAGYGNGLFGPNDVLTREQLAVMLYQYAAGCGWDVESGEALDAPDVHTVSFWAQDAVQWAVQNGVLTENAAGSLAVAAPASRADVAQAFMTLVLRYA